MNREISKLNYRIHTDVIKQHLIPEKISNAQQGFTYASEADILNVALFGVTAKEWREKNPELKGNTRDYAEINQLLVLSNMESYNAILIKQGIKQSERLKLLNEMAIDQMKSLSQFAIKSLKTIEKKNQ